MKCVYYGRFLKRCRLALVESLYGSRSVLSAVLLTSLVAIGAAPATAATCASLAGLTLPDTTITAVQPFMGGTFNAPDGGVYPNLPAFCRVAANLTPTSDSDINIEVWMPFSAWNGKFLGLGNGGFGGIFLYDVLARYIPLNYVIAQTDMGTSPGATLGFKVLTGHPEKQIDYATRSTNLMTVRSKQIIEAFYGELPKYSYFVGCSGGGGSAVHEALQFPGDYDGIVAGAPFMNVTHRSAHDLWNFQAFNGPATITLDQATAITGAVVKQCAGEDGGLSSDNFLTDPRDCHWDASSLQCTGGPADAPTCLMAQQVAGVRKFYQGPINPRTGERIYAGNPRGSENNSGFPAAFATLGQQPVLKWGLGNDFDFSTFDFGHDMDMVDEHADIVGEPLAAILNANTADLEEFKSHGGKLILTHGFADPRSPPLNTVAYYERLIASQTREGRDGAGERKEALRRTQEFARLFLFPGVGHCNGGAGPDSAKGDLLPDPYSKIDRIALDPLVEWVEHGIAPDRIIAYHVDVANNVQDFSRPVCPYPALPRYSGAGDTTQARSFICVADEDLDDNQPPAPRYLDDSDNYPIVPITPTDDHNRRDEHGDR
jgi:feruloyl esterase